MHTFGEKSSFFNLTDGYAGRFIGWDRFGEDAPTQIVDKNHFTVEATVDLSSNFYGWVFASGGEMKITAPQEAVDGFQRMLESFSERKPADETPSISIGQVKK